MRVDRGIACSACQVFTFSEGDMLTIRVLVTLRETKVNNEDCVFGIFIIANEEVVWFYISMDYSLLMDLLYALYQLYSDVKASFEVKFTSTFLEKVLE